MVNEHVHKFVCTFLSFVLSMTVHDLDNLIIKLKGFFADSAILLTTRSKISTLAGAVCSNVQLIIEHEFERAGADLNIE